MNAPKFSTQISLGNVLQIAILVFTIGAGWATFGGSLELIEQKVKTVDERSRENLQTINSEIQPRLSSIERFESRTDIRLQNIEETSSRTERVVTDIYNRISGRQ